MLRNFDTAADSDAAAAAVHFLRACEAVRVYKRKNGPISGVNLNISICSFYRFDVPNFFNLKRLWARTGSTDPTVTVRGLDATVARTSTLACPFYRAIAL